jgi:hypothetical protein
MKCFDTERWGLLIQQPDWYIHLLPELKHINELEDTERERCKEEIYDYFAKQLADEKVALGKTGKNFDSEQKTLDTVVIHHTHNPPGMTPNRLSAMTLLRLYVPYFANPYGEQDKDIKSTPLYSGHFRNGKQVFWPYHWIVRTGGITERLLNDNEIGWHAGSWEINCRSVAIVLDNNHENTRPSDTELNAIADIIKKNYPQVSRDRIFGHREINPKTTCPSNLFLPSEKHRGWKEDILQHL